MRRLMAEARTIFLAWTQLYNIFFEVPRQVKSPNPIKQL
jgi:hypothetical protein